ncbi:MAG: DUF4189 domain-containing protein [Stenotrophomonas sp.]|uniref:DUF4189 domain-containing protein n=1 Tax=Stenotrophomonas sp. TaxID=69392 RepID=UPI003D6D745B
MTTASKRPFILLAALLIAASPALAQSGAQAEMQRHAQAVNNYEGWRRNQASGAYVDQAEAAAAAQIAANFRAAEKEKIRKDAVRDWWGVVVVSTDDGAWNVELNGHDQADATLAAMKKCKGVCSPVLSFANSCLAPAYSTQGGLYWSPGETRELASAAATQACSAAGGTGCQSPPKEAICSGWKYAYRAVDRFLHRADLTARGDVAPAKLIEFPGAKEYIAKPPARRGTSTAKKAINADAPTDPMRPYAAVFAEQRAEGMTRMAQPWTAIAAGSGPKAYAIHWGLNQQDASDTALSKCGGGDCKVLVAVPHGECAVAIRVNLPNDRVASFGGRGATLDAAEEAALTDCIGSGAKACPIVFNECMK